MFDTEVWAARRSERAARDGTTNMLTPAGPADTSVAKGNGLRSWSRIRMTPDSASLVIPNVLPKSTWLHIAPNPAHLSNSVSYECYSDESR